MTTVNTVVTMVSYGCQQAAAFFVLMHAALPKMHGVLVAALCGLK